MCPLTTRGGASQSRDNDFICFDSFGALLREDEGGGGSEGKNEDMKEEIVMETRELLR